jgi:glycosyltransferase involved in cell wall biosynthesis
MQKRILVITDNLKNQINGVVTTFKNLEKQAQLNGYEIVYIDPDNFSYINCPGYPEVKISWPWGIGQKIKSSQPSYVHIATEGPIGLAARCWLDRNGWRYNTSYHTKFPEFLYNLYKIPQSLTYRYVRWFHKHSGRVLTTTETMVSDLKDHGFEGTIIPWTRGVDRNNLKPNNSKRRGSYYNLKPIVLNVGRVSKEKGLDDLCKLQDRFVIQIVGDGPYREELEKKYPDVSFLGYKTGQALADCYLNADVFCFPSQTDTFGIVIIESLSLGTPVAAYPVPGPKDILESGLTGHMSWDLEHSINLCLRYDRDRVESASQKWTWENCWKIFESNLVDIV